MLLAARSLDRHALERMSRETPLAMPAVLSHSRSDTPPIAERVFLLLPAGHGAWPTIYAPQGPTGAARTRKVADSRECDYPGRPRGFEL
jgi:hypothetical protein